MDSADPAAQAAQQLLVTFSRLRHRMREFTTGLTPSQTSILSRLDRGGESTASQLAQAERVRPQSITPTLNVLADRGLIVRRADPNDGRRQLISLSEAGRAGVRDVRRAENEWLTRSLRENLSEAELQNLRECLTMLARID